MELFSFPQLMFRQKPKTYIGIGLFSHHELGIPIVPPSGSFTTRHSTPTFHLTSFNTRSFQLSSAPQNISNIQNFSPARGILVQNSMFGSGVNQDLEEEEEDEEEDPSFVSGRKIGDQMESLVRTVAQFDF
jgi:hypothetical protein